MSTADPACEPNVLSPKQIGIVRHHLSELAASHAFAGSKRTQDFLHLIVEHALAGDLDSLRERMIGAEMFGRPVDYDTGSDSVVRVKATEVRKRLAQYYLEADRKPAVRIELPSGSYVPRFVFEPLATIALPQNEVVPPVSASAQEQEPSAKSPESPENVPSPSSTRKFSRTPRLLAGAVLGLTLIAVIAYAGYRKWSADSNARQGIHSIAILPLENLSGDPGQ
jgi:hypothetical protein